MTPSQMYERFGAWLAPAMRRAGYDIDKQNGGARTTFAQEVGISPAMMTRWLKGTAMVGPDKYDTLARILGYDDTAVMLREVGIISSQPANGHRNSAVNSPSITPTEAADGLRIRDPVNRQMFLGVVDRLTRTPETPSDEDGREDAAAEG